jgi:succinylarginine dihydrolase
VKGFVEDPSKSRIRRASCGGPACLRLRVVLNEQELATLNSIVLVKIMLRLADGLVYQSECISDNRYKALMSDWLYEQLNQWVDKHYRDRMPIEDLSDPQLLREGCTALDELTGMLPGHEALPQGRTPAREGGEASLKFWNWAPFIRSS